jgi:regulator of sigma E protease
MTTILAFIGAIALLVVFHEFGHYWVARRCGVKVLRFSVGFGKVLYSKRFVSNGTEWALSAIPLGGYVKMLDEREGDVAPEDLPYAFNRQPVLQRMAIVVAGPAANFILAVVLYWLVFVSGVQGLKPVLGEVPPDTPAAIAQMHAGETILRLNDTVIPSWQDFRWALLDAALQRGEIKIEARSAQGELLSHTLDMNSLEASDLDGDFLDKLGLHLYQPAILPVLGNIVADSVAQRAGLQPGDHILRADNQAVQYWSDVVAVIRTHPDQPVQLDIQRGAMTLSMTVIPSGVIEAGTKVGKIGAGPKIDQAAWQAMLTEVRYTPLESLAQSLRKTWETSVITLKMLGKMVIGQVSIKNLSGPITIADYAGQSAQIGLLTYLAFLALISISLGVLNLLPIPLLDGGHLLYYVVELIKGSPVPEQIWEVGQKIGIALLGTMMFFALYNDINRLITSG